MPRADPQTIRRASVSGRTEFAVASRESPTRLLIVLCFWLMLSIHDLVAGLIESCRDPMLLEKLRTPTSAERRILLGLPAENPEHMRKLRIPSFKELEAAEEVARPKSVPQPSPCPSKPMRTKVLEAVKRTVSLPQPLRRLSSPSSVVSPKLEVISRFRTSPSLASLNSPALSASPTVLPPSLSFAQSPRLRDMDPEATLRIETDLSQPLSSSPPSSSSTASTGSGRGSPGMSPFRAAFSPWLLRRRYSSSASIEAIPEEDVPVDSGACVESPVSSSDGSEFPALSSHMTGSASSPDLDTDLDSPNLTTVPPRRIATAALQIKKASLAMIAMKPSNSVPAGDTAEMVAPTPSPRSFSAPGMSRMRRRISVHRPSPAVSRVN